LRVAISATVKKNRIREEVRKENTQSIDYQQSISFFISNFKKEKAT
jgi:hypothetical protein